VLLLGKKQDIILGYAMPPTISEKAELIQVDPSAEEIGRNRTPTIGIVGDVATVTAQLAAEAARHTWTEPGWTAELRAEREAQGEWLETLAVDESPMHAMKVHKVLESFLRPDDCLVFDGGDFCHFGRAFHPALLPKRWFYVSPLGMLGTGLPTALAAKLAHPDRRVFLLTGDGGFGFNAMEFDTAVRHNLPIIGILGNDAAWGIDRQIQLGVYGKPVATDLLPTRYDQVVSGLGGYGEYVESPDELPGAIERALSSGLPALLNVMVQRAISPRAEAAVARWRSRIIQPF
jgi:acetolactate synthase-1/2/3 large subunit